MDKTPLEELKELIETAYDLAAKGNSCQGVLACAIGAMRKLEEWHPWLRLAEPVTLKAGDCVVVLPGGAMQWAQIQADAETGAAVRECEKRGLVHWLDKEDPAGLVYEVCDEDSESLAGEGSSIPAALRDWKKRSNEG